MAAKKNNKNRDKEIEESYKEITEEGLDHTENRSKNPEKSMSEDEMDEYYSKDYDDEEYAGAAPPLDDEEIEFDIENSDDMLDDLYEDDYEDYDPNA